MSVATLRYESPRGGAAPSPHTTLQPPLQRAHGAAEIGFAVADGATRLAHLYQRTPCRVLFPRAEAGDPKLAVLLTTSGGLTGGDEISLKVSASPCARATITTQAAEKIYRSLGTDATIAVELAVADGAYLEYLPQETILFEGARLRRQNRADLASGARLLACEMAVFGRAAHGETFGRGYFYDGWRVRRGGRLVWADALALEGDIGARLRSDFAFAGAEALATAFYVGDDAETHLAFARKVAQGGACRGGVSLLGPILAARFFGTPAREVRADLARFLRGLRGALGWPARLPRSWQQ